MKHFSTENKTKNPASTFAQFVLSLLVISLMLLVLYSVWHFVIRPYWQGFLFYTYVAFGLLIFLGRMSYIFRTNLTLKKTISRIGSITLPKKHFITACREKLTYFFESISVSIAWPGSSIYGGISRLDISDPDFCARASLAMSLITLFNIFIVYIFNYLLALNWIYAYTFTILMVSHVTIRHLAYLTNTESLPRQLRRNFWYPRSYWMFLLIVVIDFSVLVFSFSSIISMRDGTPVSLPLLKQVFDDIVRFQTLQNILRVNELRYTDLIIGITGLLFYITLLRTALHLKDFKPDDDDIRFQASNGMQNGHFDDALSWLKKVRNPDPLTKVMKSICYVGLNEIDKAFTCAKYLLDDENKAATQDDIFGLIMEKTLEYDKIPMEHIFLVINEGITRRISDARLLSIFDILPESRFPLDDLNGLLSDQSLVYSYPLSYSFILISKKMFDKARDLVKRSEVKDHIGKIQQNYLNILMSELDPKLDETKLQAMSKTQSGKYYNEICILIQLLSNDWEKLVAVRTLSSLCKKIVCDKTLWIGECLYKISNLKDSCKNDPYLQEKLSTVELELQRLRTNIEDRISKTKKDRPVEPSLKQPSQADFARKDKKPESLEITDEQKQFENIDKEVQAYFDLGNSAYEQNKFELGVSCYESCVKKKHDFSDAWFNWALCLYNLEKYEEAIQKYHIASHYNLENPLVYNNLGDAYYRLQEFLPAIRQYTRAIHLRPDYLKAFYNRGLAYACLSIYDKAIIDFTKVTSLDPNFTEAWNIRGLAFHYNQEYVKAVEDFNKAIELNPNFAEAFAHRGNSKYLLKDEGGAFADFNKAIEINQGSAQAYYNRGLIYYQKADYKNAIDDFGFSIAKNYPDLWDAFYQRGWAYRSNGDDENAIIAFMESLKNKHPEPWYAYYSCGLSYHDLGTQTNSKEYFYKAIRNFDDALNINPRYPECFNSRGLTKTNLKDYEGAIKDFTESIEQNNAEPWLPYCNRGIARLELPDYENAIKDFTTALQLKNDYDYAYYGLGALKLKTYNFKESVKYFNMAIERQNEKSSRAYYCSWRAIAHAYLADEEAALEDIKYVSEENRLLYNISCSYSVLHKMTQKNDYKLKAFDCLKVVIDRKLIDKVTVRDDPDWQHLKGDPEFLSIVGSCQ